MPQVLSRMARASPAELVVSTFVAAELAGGVMLSARIAANRRALELFLGAVTVEGRGAGAVWHDRGQAACLRAAGTPIGTTDLPLACQVLGDDGTVVVVTHNTRGFGRVEGLAREDWTTP